MLLIIFLYKQLFHISLCASFSGSLRLFLVFVVGLDAFFKVFGDWVSLCLVGTPIDGKSMLLGVDVEIGGMICVLQLITP